MANCITCSKETNNPKYCSRTCSAISTNKLYPKRKTKKKCIVCSEPVKSFRHNRCSPCLDKYKLTKYKDKTIGEYRNKLSLEGKHTSWANPHIRTFARRWLKHLTELPCAKCGYDKHVELAHIKPVSSFDDSAKLEEVNSPDNIIQLCPNCHWEMDNLKT